MPRTFICFLLYFIVGINSANAQYEQSTLPPRYAIGGGLGWTGMIHVDYQNWITEKTSVELGLTPLLLHNVLLVSANRHIEISKTPSTNRNLLVSGSYLGIANIGFIYNGVGVRVGYESLKNRVGYSLVGGPFVRLDIADSQPMLDVRATVWWIKR